MTIKRIEEMEKLERYLIDKNIPYEINMVESYDAIWPIKSDKPRTYYKQICVPVFDPEKRKWDAVCNRGTYGFEDGLLEIMGDILTEEDLEYDTVKGFLTADDVIERIELKEKSEDKKTMTTPEAIVEIIQNLKIITNVLSDIDKELFIHRYEIASIKDRLNALESEKEKCDDSKTM